MLNKLLVEFLGTMVFLYVIITVNNPIAIGLALTLVIMLGGKVSGGHFNPAVSIMKYLNGNLSKNDLPLYILSQILGGVMALQLFKKVKF
tara:strand:+ start:1805 stop:2074 length:270 start_codon:yes stop_codon:yes gene_type:complete